MDEYTFDRWLAVQTTDTYSDGDEDYKALSAKIASSGWSSLDKAEKAAFSDRHLKAIRPESVMETTGAFPAPDCCLIFAPLKGYVTRNPPLSVKPLWSH